MGTKEKDESKSAIASFLIIGMSTAILLVSPVLALFLIGYFVDKFFHTTPFFMILGLTLGFISGIMNVFKLLKVMQQRKKHGSPSMI